jgi:dTDP-glucose 4,6-dehydratase/UDP-glucose 4-epimerase
MNSDRFEYDITADVGALIERSGINAEILRGKTILVTGGTGFFGLWLLSALVHIHQRLHGDMRILVLSRRADAFFSAHPGAGLEGAIECIPADIIDARLDPGLGVTHLIHMATTRASETYLGEDQLRKLDLLYRGTRNILEQCGDSLESVVFTSSGVAYGAGAGNERIREDDRTGPYTLDSGSALGLGKLTAEYLVAYFAQRLGYRYSVARCFAFAGQFLPLDLHYAFGNFIRDAILGNNIVIRGDGKDVRSYLYVGDAIAWLLGLLVDPRDDLFNVGSSTPVSVEVLARTIAARAERPVRVKIEGRAAEAGNFRRSIYVPSTEKIRAHYPGLQEWTPLDAVIDKMLKSKLA